MFLGDYLTLARLHVMTLTGKSESLEVRTWAAYFVHEAQPIVPDNKRWIRDKISSLDSSVYDAAMEARMSFDESQRDALTQCAYALAVSFRHSRATATRQEIAMTLRGAKAACPQKRAHARIEFGKRNQIRPEIKYIQPTLLLFLIFSLLPIFPLQSYEEK